MLVAGVDGCPAGWIIVTAEANRDRLKLRAFEVIPTFAAMLLLTADCAAVAVDIPIGLSEGPPRQADLLTRSFLGRPRASSVFPAPPRPVLAASDYAGACDASALACGKRMSRQAFNILPKIREADESMTPSLQLRVIEAHPEAAFALLAGGIALPDNKKTAAGRSARVALLTTVFGEDLSLRRVPSGAARDDFYDAAALVRTAQRLLDGTAVHLPPEPAHDSRGLRMGIVY